MAFETLKYSVENNVASITFTRPEKLNTLNMKVWAEIVEALDTAEKDDEVNSMLIMGEGRAFCAGFDMDDSAEQKEQSVWEQWLELRSERENSLRLWNFRKPIVAAVQGYCLGGGLELVNLVDFIIAADNAKFGESEMQYSFLPQPSMLWLLGARKTKEILMLAERFTAEEAYRIGFVNKVVPLENLEAESRRIAERLAKMPTETMQLTKKMINKALDEQGMDIIGEWGWDTFLVSKLMTTKLSAEYDRIAAEQGTSAAIKWMNERFKN